MKIMSTAIHCPRQTYESWLFKYPIAYHQGRNHWGVTPPPNFLEDPANFWHNFFVGGSTVKPAEWIWCIIQKKKEEILPVIIAGIIRFLRLVGYMAFIWQCEEIFVYKIHTLILYFVCT